MERLGGVSSIRWTARGPANSERSKCWPFTTTFLQSRETAVTVVAESRNRAGNGPSMPCAHMAVGSCRKSRRSGSVEKRRDGSVAARATEQEDRKRRSRRDKNSATRKLRAGHAIKGNQSIVPSNARTLACTSIPLNSLLLRPAATQSRPQCSAVSRHVSSCANRRSVRQ